MKSHFAKIAAAMLLLGIGTGQAGGLMICGMSSQHCGVEQPAQPGSHDCCSDASEKKCPMSSIGDCCHATPAIAPAVIVSIPAFGEAGTPALAALKTPPAIPSDLLQPPRA